MVQSRAGRVRDVLTREQVNEIADAPAGSVGETIREVSGGVGSKKRDAERMGVQGATSSASPDAAEVQQQQQQQPKLSVASVSKDGKVSFEATKDGKSG